MADIKCEKHRASRTTRYVRGSNGIGYKERIKVMKLLWDAVGTEFADRHALYEANYAGNHQDVRIA